MEVAAIRRKGGSALTTYVFLARIILKLINLHTSHNTNGDVTIQKNQMFAKTVLRYHHISFLKNESDVPKKVDINHEGVFLKTASDN